MASCFPTRWQTGILGYFETSAIWRGCHSIIKKLWCRAYFFAAFLSFSCKKKVNALYLSAFEEKMPERW